MCGTSQCIWATRAVVCVCVCDIMSCVTLCVTIFSVRLCSGGGCVMINPPFFLPLSIPTPEEGAPSPSVRPLTHSRSD